MKLLICLFLIFSNNVNANELIEKKYEGEVENSNLVEAKDEIFKQAIQEISNEMISQILGPKKFQTHKDVIRNRVIKNSAKYIPIINAENPQTDGKLSRMIVTLKVSVENLHKLLLENGLLYQKDEYPIILPLIGIRSQNQLNGWWLQTDQILTDENLQKYSLEFEHELQSTFLSGSFFVLKPERMLYINMIPDIYKKWDLNPSDLVSIAGLFKAQIALHGRILFENKEGIEEIKIQLTALNVSNNRVVSDISRTIPNKNLWREKIKEMAQDILVQMQDSWRKGTFGTQLVKITFQGKMSYQGSQGLKNYLNKNFLEIRSVKERYFSAEATQYELEIQGDIKDIAEKLNKVSFERFQLNILSIENNHLTARLKESN